MTGSSSPISSPSTIPCNSQSIALVFCLVRLCADARAAPCGNQRHPAGPRPMHHATAETVEDRGAGESHRAQDMAIVCTVICLSANLDAGAGEFAAVPGVASSRITVARPWLPDGAPWGEGFARLGGAGTPDNGHYTAQIRLPSPKTNWPNRRSSPQRPSRPPNPLQSA